MNLLAQLRQATAPLHAALEADFDRVNGLRTGEDLAALLSKFYGFHRAWEAAVQAVDSPASALMEGRWRTDALKTDLAALGRDADALPVCDRLPDLSSEGRRFGSIYVMEGSTLGGQVVARQIENRLGLRDGVGYSYFSGNGSAVGSRWKEFLGRMLPLAEREPPNEVTAGAVHTFETLAEWFRSGSAVEVEADR